MSLLVLRKKFDFVKSVECDKLKQTLQDAFPDAWISLLEKKSPLNGNDVLRKPFEELFEKITQRQKTITLEQFNLIEIESIITSQNHDLMNTEIIDDSTYYLDFDINIDAIRNHYLLQAITGAVDNTNFDLNQEFYKLDSFFDCNDQQLIQIIGAEEYKLFINIWVDLKRRISHDFQQAFNFLGSNYKLISTFYKKISNMVNVLLIKNVRINNMISQNFESNCNNKSYYNGPEFTNRMLSFLIDDSGNSKNIPLKFLSTWQKNISELNEMIWVNRPLRNVAISKLNFEKSLFLSEKLLAEMKYIEGRLKLNEKEDTGFQKLVSKLIECSKRIPKNNTETTYTTAILNSIIGSLELCLSTVLPLIDPVKKQELKKEYNMENIDHLKYMKNAYELIQSVMKYKNLGNEVTLKISEQIEILELKSQKYQRKSAFRPQKSLYRDMTEEIKHFLLTNGNPSGLLSIINLIDEQIGYFNMPNKSMKELDIDSIVKRLNLWITNSNRFLFHTLKKYNTYYKDFTEPIEHSLNSIQLGFESLKYILQRKHNSIIKTPTGSYMNISSNLKDILMNLIEFPTQSINLQDNNASLKIILENVDGGGILYFSFLKVKIKELQNSITKSKELDDYVFAELYYVFRMCNKIWNDEEENRIKIKQQNESLYTTM